MSTILTLLTEIRDLLKWHKDRLLESDRVSTEMWEKHKAEMAERSEQEKNRPIRYRGRFHQPSPTDPIKE